MASLLIGAVINVGLGLVINEFFGPGDIDQIGPRRGDQEITDSAYGRPIFRHWGGIRTSGQIIWTKDGVEEVIKTTTTTVGGLFGIGGQTVKTTEFLAKTSIAVSFGEGVAEDVLRIWGAGKLLFDKTGTSTTQEDGFRFRFYPGDETQLPDPLIEDTEGVGNVSAHRGMCYIVIEDWFLDEFGKQIPNLTAEIAYQTTTNNSVTSLTTLSDFDGPNGGEWIFIDPDSDFFYVGGSLSTTFSANQLSTMNNLNNMPGANFNAPGIKVQQDRFVLRQSGSGNSEPFDKIDPFTGEELFSYTFNEPNNGTEAGMKLFQALDGTITKKLVIMSRRGPFGDDGYSIYTDNDDLIPPSATRHGLYTDANLSGMDNGVVIQDWFTGKCYFIAENTTTLNLHEFEDHTGQSGDINTDTIVRLVGSFTKGTGMQMEGTDPTDGNCLLPDENAVILSNGTGIIKVDLDDGTLLTTRSSGGFTSNGNWSRNGKFAHAATGGTITTISTDDLTTLVTQDVSDFSVSNPVGTDDQGYDSRSNSLLLGFGSTVERLFLDRNARASDTADNIVSDISITMGLTAADLNVANISGLVVEGYSVTRQMTGRQAIFPLQQALFFKGIESDWIMKFDPLDFTPQLTITENDVGKLSRGTEEFVKEKRLQEVELPLRVAVKFTNLDKDYEEDERDFSRTKNPISSQDSDNFSTTTLDIVMSAQTAKRIAVKILFTAWAQRSGLSFSTAWRYLALDPGDALNVVYRGVTRLDRLTEQIIGANNENILDMVDLDSDSLTSDVPAGDPEGFDPQVVPSGLPTRLHVLNLPLMAPADDTDGSTTVVYWGASGYDTSWPGAELSQSLDQGNSYTVVGASEIEMGWGQVAGTIPDPEELNNGGTTTWDRNTSINLIPVRGSDDLVSLSEIEVLNGANAIAIVRLDNSVEIMQFATATVVDTATIAISDLLRGRSGTTPEAFSHTAGEFYVLLKDNNSVQQFSLGITRINLSLPYRGVTLNTMFDDAPIVSHTHLATDLKPYAPVHILGVPNPGTDKTWTWTRRTRFDGELLNFTGTVPLNETSELYDVELYESDGTTLITSATDLASATFTVTEIDWTGSLGQSLVNGEIPPTIIDVYQKSSVVGRGKVLRVTA